MNKLIQSQGDMFAVSMMMGAGMGLVYDLLRSIRKAFSHSDTLVGIEDIIYWLFWTWFFIENIFRYNDGSFRIYIFIIAITGLIIYKYTISSGVFKILNYILCFVKKCVEKPKKLLKNGIKWYKIKISIFRNFKNFEKEKDAYLSSDRGKDERKERKKKVYKKTV